MQSFPKATADLSFLELNKELSLEDLVLPQGTALPLFTEVLEEKISQGDLDLGTKELASGILYLYGADPDFKDKELYREIIGRVQPVYGLLLDTLKESPFRALVMTRGLISLGLEEEGMYLLAAEACNELVKEGQNYSELALAFLEKEDPSWGVSYHQGYHFFHLERYAEALEAWKRLLEQDAPEEIQTEVLTRIPLAERRQDYLRGKELLFKERFEEARQVFKSLLPDFPHWYELHFYYGLSLRFLEEYKEALSTFYSLLQHHREDIHLYNELAICHLFVGEAAEAKILLEEGLKLAEHPDLHLNLAIALFELKDQLGAFEEIKRAEQLAPDDELIQTWKEHMRKDRE